MTTTETTPSDAQEMASAYDPSQVEERIYRWWEESGWFAPSGEGRPFTIIMPPPNVTGELHLGHALTDAIEDILIRWHRMLGDDTLWLPGVDHAAIAVQNVVERRAAPRGHRRARDIGREELPRAGLGVGAQARAVAISRQHRRLGASADWSASASRWTTAPQRPCARPSSTLYDDGLIYRGERLINWCPDCRPRSPTSRWSTPRADGFFWYVRYPVARRRRAAATGRVHRSSRPRGRRRSRPTPPSP